MPTQTTSALGFSNQWHMTICLCYNVRMRIATLLFLVCLAEAFPTLAQKDDHVLPTVTDFECPKYPSDAKSMRLSGTVKMQVTTDGHLIANVEMDAERGNSLVEQGFADMVAFGRPYIANPDLVERLATGAPLAVIDWSTVYASGPQGYSDYPAIRMAKI